MKVIIKFSRTFYVPFEKDRKIMRIKKKEHYMIFWGSGFSIWAFNFYKFKGIYGLEVEVNKGDSFFINDYYNELFSMWLTCIRNKVKNVKQGLTVNILQSILNLEIRKFFFFSFAMQENREITDKLERLRNKKDEWTTLSFKDKLDLLNRSFEILKQKKDEVWYIMILKKKIAYHSCSGLGYVVKQRIWTLRFHMKK